jgi:hypothetical protein
MAAEEVTAERKTNVDSTKNLEELKTMWVLTPLNQIKYKYNSIFICEKLHWSFWGVMVYI